MTTVAQLPGSFLSPETLLFGLVMPLKVALGCKATPPPTSHPLAAHHPKTPFHTSSNIHDCCGLSYATFG